MGKATQSWFFAVLAMISWPVAAVPAEFAELAGRCAPDVHPATLAAVVAAESGFNPLAIGVNGPDAPKIRASSREEAVAAAEKLLEDGRSIDLGLGQINSANLARLGLTLESAFDPCENLRAAAVVLVENFDRHRGQAADEQAALTAALSTYNTGSPTRGVSNGYVARVRERAGEYRVPALSDSSAPAPAAAPIPSWDVFGQALGRPDASRPSTSVVFADAGEIAESE